MENASKALIIAGAILISILIISFGVIILGQGGDVINNANMSDAEITAVNGKFEAYEGENVRGSNVKQLMKTVAAHNRSQDSDKRVIVQDGTGKSGTGVDNGYADTYDKNIDNVTLIKDDGTETTKVSGISSSKFYTVRCAYGPTGLVRYIVVKSK